MSFRIRVATVDDMPSMLQIWTTGAYAANGEHPREAEVKRLAVVISKTIDSNTPSAKVWIAENDGSIIGWQSLFPCRQNPFFYDRHVESSTYTQRRSGIRDLGNQLLSKATSFANDAPIDMILGFVRSSNLASIRMMAHCGFTCAGSMPLRAEASDSPRQIWYYDATN